MDHSEAIPSKTFQVNKYLDRRCKFKGRNSEINACPMVQNCIRKLPVKHIDVRLELQLKANKTYSYAPAIANQPTSPPSGGCFVYSSGGAGLKSYEPSSRVWSKSARPLWLFFALTNAMVLGVYGGGALSRSFLKGKNRASQLFKKISTSQPRMWLGYDLLLWNLRPIFRIRLHNALREWTRRQSRELNDRNRPLSLSPNRLRSSRQ